MAWDQGLEARIDELGGGRLTKRRMFGGIGYLLEGNMAFGIWKDALIVRCGPERYAEALARPHVREFDVTGRAMAGWVMVEPAAIEEDDALAQWLQSGADFAATLPPK